MARQQLRAASGQTLESAAVTHEVYIKLTRAGRILCENRVHFLALCSQMIRRILVDHVRSRLKAKRGGVADNLPLDAVTVGIEARGVDLMGLDEALDSSTLDARKTRVVELRYFGGLTLDETAQVLKISPETAKRDWRIAKTWLMPELTRKQGTRHLGDVSK
jgi:RNA polymerase sigma factor (TIGR02999 family)